MARNNGEASLTDQEVKAVKALVEEFGDGDLHEGMSALAQLAQERQTWLPSRRDFLKGGAGAGIGIAGLLAASGPAQAADTSTAELGAAGASWDVYLDELKDPQGDNLVDVDDTGVLQWQRGFDVPSLATESAAIGTVSGQGDVFRLTDRRTPSSDTSQIQFTGLSDDVEYKIWVSSLHFMSSADDVFLRLNGDGGSTGNYDYWDASGTKQTGENQFLLASFADNGPFASEITVTNTPFDDSRETGIRNDILPSDSNINDFGREGSRTALGSLNSIELITGPNMGGFEAPNSVIELWKRDYS